MKKSMLMVLAVLFAASNMSAVRRQNTVSAGEEVAAQVEAEREAQRLARQIRIEYGNNASEQNRAKPAPAQSAPKAPKAKKASHVEQDNTAPKNTTSQAEQEKAPNAESTTPVQDAPAQDTQKEQASVVAAQPSYATRLLKLGAVVGTAGAVTLAACKAYMLANPVIYPVLVHNTVAGATWCFANCL